MHRHVRHRLSIRTKRHIATDADRLAASPFDEVQHFLRRSGIEILHDNFRSFLGKEQGGGAPGAGAGSSDERDLMGKSIGHG